MSAHLRNSLTWLDMYHNTGLSILSDVYSLPLMLEEKYLGETNI